MRTPKTLTIAIPAYNMEHYLGRCLDSICDQNVINKIEILVINDGSTDKTLKIAQNYKSTFPDSIKIIDKPNGGWGSAINMAITYATGEYFKILDSDDWFDTKSLYDFCDLLSNVDADLIATSFSYVYDDQTEKNDIYEEKICGKVTSFSKYLIDNNFNKHIPMAAITYKTELLKNHNIELCKRYYADIDYNLTPLIYVDTIYFSNIILYKYYIGRDGQSTSLSGYKNHLLDYMNMCKKIISFYSQNESKIKNEIIKETYIIDCCNVIQFMYYIFLSPIYNVNIKDNLGVLIQFDNYLKYNSPIMYKKTGRFCIKKIIPYISIWRKFNINILTLSKLWI